MRIREAGRLWEIELVEDCSTYTLVEVQPVDSTGALPKHYMRFDPVSVSHFRRENGDITMEGLRTLARIVVHDYNELAA